MTDFRRPHEAVNYEALTAQLPPPPEYLDTAYLASPDTIAATQLARLQARARAAYERMRSAQSTESEVAMVSCSAGCRPWTKARSTAAST